MFESVLAPELIVVNTHLPFELVAPVSLLPSVGGVTSAGINVPDRYLSSLTLYVYPGVLLNVDVLSFRVSFQASMFALAPEPSTPI